MRSAAQRWRRLSGGAVDVAILIVILGLAWQVVYEIAGEVAVTSPLVTLRHAYGLLRSTDFWPNVRVTFVAFGLALIISVVGGLSAGALLGLSRLAGDAAEPVLVALYSIPKVAFYPVILLFFGIGVASEVAFGVFHGVLPITIFTMNAVAHVKPIYLKMGRGLGLGRAQLIRTIAVPAALPEIFTGLRVGFSLTFIGTLLSEMFASRAGIGHMLMNAMGLNSVELIMALAFLILLFAALVNTALMVVDKRLHRRA
jgi:NitT/TauT family transport system permease protein